MTRYLGSTTFESTRMAYDISMKKNTALLGLLISTMTAYVLIENHFAEKYYELYKESGSHFSFSEAILKDRIGNLNSEIRSRKDGEILSQLKEERNELRLALYGEVPLRKELRLKILNQEDFHYFAWVSGTSTGYGDIFPLSTRARSAVKNQVILSLTLLSLISSLIIAFVISVKEKILGR